MERLPVDLIIPVRHPSHLHRIDLYNYSVMLEKVLDCRIHVIVVFDCEDVYEYHVEGIWVDFVFHLKNMGKGAAIRSGLHYAVSQFIFYTDCDFPYEVSDVAKMYTVLLSGADIVTATRSYGYYRQLPIIRKILSITIRLLLRRDTQGGLKGMNRRGAYLLSCGRSRRYLFDSEWFVRAMFCEKIFVSSVMVHPRPTLHLPNYSAKMYLEEVLDIFRIMIEIVSLKPLNSICPATTNASVTKMDKL